MNKEFMDTLRERLMNVFNHSLLGWADIAHIIKVSRVTLYRFLHCEDAVFSKATLKKILNYVDKWELHS